jgi:hypothetical protein
MFKTSWLFSPEVPISARPVIGGPLSARAEGPAGAEGDRGSRPGKRARRTWRHAGVGRRRAAMRRAWRGAWSRQQVVDGMSQRDDGALVDDGFHGVRPRGGLDRRAGVQGPARQRAMGPVGPYLVRDGWKTWVGIERLPALPAWLGREEALMPWVGGKAQHGRHRVCPRGAAKRPHPRPEGPVGPEPLAQAGPCGTQVTGMIAAPAPETTAADAGWGPVPRTRTITAKHGHVRASAVTAAGWQPSGVRDALPPIPLAVRVVPSHAPAGRSRRALVTQGRAHPKGCTRLHPVVFERGGLEGAERWWLDPRGLTVVGPAKAPGAPRAGPKGLDGTPGDGGGGDRRAGDR